MSAFLWETHADVIQRPLTGHRPRCYFQHHLGTAGRRDVLVKDGVLYIHTLRTDGDDADERHSDML